MPTLIENLIKNLKNLQNSSFDRHGLLWIIDFLILRTCIFAGKVKNRENFFLNTLMYGSFIPVQRYFVSLLSVY